MNTMVDQIIGYYEGENLIRPVFEALTLEEFRRQYPDRQPVMASHLAQDDDYTPDPEEEVEV